MKRNILLGLVLMMMFLCACTQPAGNPSGSGEATPTWQEQYDLGVRYLSEGNYQEAIIAFTAAIEIDPKRAEAYVGRGDAYVGSGETAQNLAAAQTDYEKAVELDTADSNAWLRLSEVYILRGDIEAALVLLQEALGKVSDSSLVSDKIDELSQLLAGDSPLLEEYIFESHAAANGMDVYAEGLTIQVRDGRTATITIGGLSLKDSYLTDLAASEQNMAEYHWNVSIYGDQEAFSVSTSYWAFEPGREREMSLSDMQHSVWIVDSDGWTNIANADMSYTSSSITWTFTVPEEYPFNFLNVNRYEVTITDISQNLYLQRVYTLQ